MSERKSKKYLSPMVMTLVRDDETTILRVCFDRGESNKSKERNRRNAIQEEKEKTA